MNNMETMHAADLLSHIDGRLWEDVMAELAFPSCEYNVPNARGRIQNALDKGFLTVINGTFHATHIGVAYMEDVEAYYEDLARQQDAEIEAEFGASWIAGGGRREDVSLAWAMHREAYTAGVIG